MVLRLKNMLMHLENVLGFQTYFTFAVPSLNNIIQETIVASYYTAAEEEPTVDLTKTSRKGRKPAAEKEKPKSKASKIHVPWAISPHKCPDKCIRRRHGGFWH